MNEAVDNEQPLTPPTGDQRMALEIPNAPLYVYRPRTWPVTSL